MDSKNIMEEMVGQRMLDIISLKKFLQDYKRELSANKTSHVNVQIAMNLSNETERFEKVAAKCALTHLEQVDDANIVSFIPGDSESKLGYIKDPPIGSHKLRTFKTLIESKNSSQRNPFRRSSEIFKLTEFPRNITQSLKSKEECPYYDDILISIRIYRPARATHIGRTLEKPVFAEQFQCLGSNFLTELRDKITCICNKHHFFDISIDPDAKLPEKETDPGFFFITDTFYNDFRNPKNSDYSSIIRKWARKVCGLKEIDFHIAKMEETRFIDLNVSMGFPQLYQHHGNCEHLFTFSQVDILTPTLTYNQLTSRHIYPRLHSFGLYNNRLCNMCGKIHYVYIVENSDRQLHDPAYLCHQCFKSFHYIDGEKIGNFRAYRVHDYTFQRDEIGIIELEDNNKENDYLNDDIAANIEEIFVDNPDGDIDSSLNIDK